MHIVSFARAVSPLHTHSLRSRSDDPGFARPAIGRLVSFVQVFVEAVCFANSWSFFLFYSGTLIFLAFILLPDSCHISSVLIPVTILTLDSYDIMRGWLYVLLQWSMIILVLIYSLFRLQLRLSVYTWGIFLAYMRRHNVSVSLGSGRYIYLHLVEDLNYFIHVWILLVVL